MTLNQVETIKVPSSFLVSGVNELSDEIKQRLLTFTQIKDDEAKRIEADAIASGHPSRQIKSSGFSMMRLVFSLFRPFMKAAPFQVDEILTADLVMPVLGGLHVVDTAGHTPGHVSLFAPAAGILFSGDSLVTDENGIHGSRPGLTWDDAKARQAEQKQVALGAYIVCPGHGPVVFDAIGKFIV